MTARRFRAGQQREFDGIRVRIVPGYKRTRGDADDLRLEWETPSGWRAVSMATVLAMADFFYENEDALYPPPRYQGGRYWADALTRAMQSGWRTVAREIADARRACA